MRRSIQSLTLLALMAICFLTQGKTPRMPEMRGSATLEMALRMGAEKIQDNA